MARTLTAMDSENYRINDIARLCEVSASTIRLWEQHGLLLPQRLDSGHRVYSADDLARARRIQHLRKISGLNINAIKTVLADMPQPSTPSAQKARAKTSTANLPVASSLGARFRAARHKSGFSLRATAEHTGLAQSFISTFERTSTGATIASLQSLASCYGTTVSALSAQPAAASAHSSALTRTGSERQLPTLGPGIRILQLSDSLKLLDCQKWILQPGAGSDGTYSHEGEELIHVLSGQFWICLDDQSEQVLAAGDSISFSSERRHAWKAVGDAETTLLWINTPRSF